MDLSRKNERLNSHLVFLFYVLASHFTALQRNSMYILHIEMHVLNTCILLFFHIKVKSFNIFKFWKCSGHNMKNITCKTRNHHLVLWKSSSKSLKLSSYYLKLLPCFLKLPWNNVKISLVSFFTCYDGSNTLLCLRHCLSFSKRFLCTLLCRVSVMKNFLLCHLWTIITIITAQVGALQSSAAPYGASRTILMSTWKSNLALHLCNAEMCVFRYRSSLKQPMLF